MNNFFFLNKIKTLKMFLLGKKIFLCKGAKLVYNKINQIKLEDGKLILGLSHYKNNYYKKSILDIKKDGLLEINGIVRIFTGHKIDIHDNGILKIGSNVQINDDAKIGVKEFLEIGDDSLIGDNVNIHDFDGHKIILKNYKESKPIKIGKNVWIGTNVTILKGVTIGDGCIIGANSVVTKNIPPHCLAAGNPAVVKKENVVWEK